MELSELEKLYKRYHKELVFYAMNKFSFGQEMAEDAVSKVFERLIDRELRDRKNIRSFLYVSVRNQVIDDIRTVKMVREHQKREQEIAEISYSPYDLTEDIMYYQVRSEIKSAIDQLPNAAKVCFMEHMKDVPTLDIAAQMGVSPQTVRNQIVKARMKVTDIIKKRLNIKNDSP